VHEAVRLQGAAQVGGPGRRSGPPEEGDAARAPAGDDLPHDRFNLVRLQPGPHHAVEEREGNAGQGPHQTGLHDGFGPRQVTEERKKSEEVLFDRADHVGS